VGFAGGDTSKKHESRGGKILKQHILGNFISSFIENFSSFKNFQTLQSCLWFSHLQV
jgi:hypothetical protein